MQKGKPYLMSIDLSTSCTGIAYFDVEGNLLTYEKIKGSTKGLSKLIYPFKPLLKMENMADAVMSKVLEVKDFVKFIVIEEIAGSKQRLGQKTLDGVHWSLVRRLYEAGMENLVYYYDVTGKDGWRHHLGMVLSKADKLDNKQARKLNKDIARGETKLPIINHKKLAERYANEQFGLTLNVWENTTDADVADAICMGHAFLVKRIKHV